MDRLMSMGVRFARVRSQASWTKPSMASLWTSVSPLATGVQRYPDALAAGAAMPAEVLREAGFVTCGIFRNGWVSHNFGFGQGFDLYFQPGPSVDPERLARHNPSSHPLTGTDLDATRAALEFLRIHRQRRFFLYLHYMDVHQYAYDAESARFGTGLLDAYDNATLGIGLTC
jgi:arylsulfatase A-like enzyme